MTWLAAIETTVNALGFELVDAERTAGGLLRVSIDRRQGDPRGEFIVVEDCEAVTRQLQHVLEVEGCDYARLEVSSPGLDRPLKKPADYARFAGRPIELTLKLPFQGRKRYRGTLQAAGAGWQLLLDAAAAKPASAAADEVDRVLDFQLDEVREARLVPVLDFKGRRFALAAPAGSGSLAAAGVDGGLEQ